MKPQRKAPPPALEKQRQPGRIRSVFLAVAVHAAFFALIVFGVTWQSRPEVPVQAEIWDKLPPAPTKAAPKAQPKPPEPEPVKPDPAKEEPRPKPEPVKTAPKPPETKPEPVKPDPAIARKLEREKEKKEKAEREKLQKQKEDEAKKKREKEEAEKKKRDEEVKRKEDERLKAEAEKARAEAAAAKKSEIDRYIDGIKNKIRGKANVPDSVTGNPEVQVRIRVLPGGEVLDITVTKKSGNPTYDAAIERGIRSASPLPVPPASSELFPQFRDLNLNIRHER